MSSTSNKRLQDAAEDTLPPPKKASTTTITTETLAQGPKSPAGRVVSEDSETTTAINTKEVDIAAHLGLKDGDRLVVLWDVEYEEEKEGEEEGKTETSSSSSSSTETETATITTTTTTSQHWWGAFLEPWDGKMHGKV